MARKRKDGASIIADSNFVPFGSVKIDSKKRVVLKGEVAEHYHIYRSSEGQILLDPMVLIPAREAWLHQNPKALASVRRGIKQLAQGKLVKMPSLAEYADEPLDD